MIQTPGLLLQTSTLSVTYFIEQFARTPKSQYSPCCLLASIAQLKTANRSTHFALQGTFLLDRSCSCKIRSVLKDLALPVLTQP